MKATQKILNVIPVLFAVSPIVYLLLYWGSVPETITTRFNFNEPTFKEQSRQTLLILTIVISITGIVIYFLMRNLEKFDPKVKSDTPTSGFNRMGLSLMVFLVLLNFYFILSAMHSWEISKKILFLFFALLIAVIGNYMHNIRPNYFAGLRIPWTLNDENNWRQTHHFAGKLWFSTGLALAIICGILPGTALQPVFIVTISLIVLIPCVYSYRLYKSKK